MYDPTQPRVPAGQPGAGQWVGHNISRTRFNRLSPHERQDFLHGGGAVTDFHVTDLYARISKPDGGFTYKPVSHKQPHAGFALSLYPNRSFSADVNQLKFRDLALYVKRNRDLLKQPTNYLGAWHDPATHRVYFDVSTVVGKASQADLLAREHDQIAYFDLRAGKSITVNPRATSGGAAHHA